MKNEYLLLMGSLTLSRVIRNFGEAQKRRNVLNRPLTWNNTIVVFMLIAAWLSLLIIGLVKGFQIGGIKTLLYFLAFYFIILPTVFEGFVKH